jgi:serine/threonine protein kinase
MITDNTILNDRYRLEKKIGQGGFAQVFLATDGRLRRRVAVKVLNADLSEDENFLTRFDREAQAIAALDHPNILAVFDYGEAENTAYLVMPYIEGGTLHDLLKREKFLAPQHAAKYLNQAAAALDYAHRKQTIHRDIKPHNILLREADDHVLLADFGLAKVIGSAGASGSTAVMGTISYMSPEQLNGVPSLQSDVYALGVVLYQMLVGELPYSGATETVIMGHLTQPVPSVAERSGGRLPTAFQAIFDRALAKNPAQRYQSAGELARHFQNAVNGAIVADDPTVALPRSSQSLPSVLVPDPEATSQIVIPPARKKRGSGWLLGAMAAVIVGILATIGLVVALVSNSDRQNQPGTPVVQIPSATASATVTAGLTPLDTVTPAPTPTIDAPATNQAATITAIGQGFVNLQTQSALTADAIIRNDATATASAIAEATGFAQAAEFRATAAANLTAGYLVSQTAIAQNATASAQTVTARAAQTATVLARPTPTLAPPLPTNTLAPPPNTPVPGASLVNFGNGRVLVYASTRGDKDAVWVFDGQSERQLSDAALNCSNPSFSADGRQVAMQCSSGSGFFVHTVGVDGRNPARIMPGALVSWSPDGSSLTFIADPTECSSPEQVLIRRIGENSSRRLTCDGNRKLGPRFSPDGSRIAYSEFVNNRWMLSIIDTQGNNKRSYDKIAFNARFPVWSPDGSQIAFNSGDGTGRDAQIFILNVTTGDTRQITNESQGFNGRPFWTKDNLIVFHSNRDNPGRVDRDGAPVQALYVMRADGSNQQRLPIVNTEDNYAPTLNGG